MSETDDEQKEALHFTKSLSPSCLFPVFFNLETINGQMTKMFVTTSSRTGIQPGRFILVMKRYYMLSSDQTSVTSSLHRQSGKGTRAVEQWNYLHWRRDLQQTGLKRENTLQ